MHYSSLKSLSVGFFLWRMIVSKNTWSWWPFHSIFSFTKFIKHCFIREVHVCALEFGWIFFLHYSWKTLWSYGRMIVSNNACYCAILINVLFQLNLVQLKKGNTFLEQYEKEIYPLFVSCMNFSLGFRNCDWL